jgi:hypothetical protein
MVKFYVLVLAITALFLLLDWGYYNLDERYKSFKTYMYEAYNLLHGVTLISLGVLLVVTCVYIAAGILYACGHI